MSTCRQVNQNVAALLLVFLPVVWAACLSVARGADEEQIDTARALKSIGRQAWYDRQADGYAPPKVEDPVDNPLRTKGWIAEKANDKKVQQAQGGQSSWGNWNWGLPSIDPNLFSSLVIAVLAMALVAVIGLLTYHSLRHYMPGRWEARKSRRAVEIDTAKVSDLPFEVQPQSHHHPLAEAEALMRAGDYSRAIVYLYGYMLLALDQSRNIELQRGKTNRMYLRELNPLPQLRQLVEGTMLSFEQVYFGKRTLSREQFLASWDRLEQFHQLIPTGQQASSGPLVTEVLPT